METVKQSYSRSGAVYQCADYLLLRADVETDANWVIAAEPVLKLPLTATPLEIGKVLSGLISEAKTQVPHPTDWKQSQKEYLRSMGFKTNKELQTMCRLCMVSYIDNSFVLHPTRSAKTEFLVLPGKSLTVSDSDFVALGIAVLQTMQESY